MRGALPTVVRGICDTRLTLTGGTIAPWVASSRRSGHPRAVGQSGPHASPVEGAVVGGQDGGPLARVPEEETTPARRARGGGHPVASAKELVPAAQGGEVGFDVGEPDGGVSNELVEVLHDHLLGQDRQVAERAVGEALVKAPVEQRAGVSVLAHAVQRPALVLLELSACPAV